MTEEKKRILDLLEQGKLTAREAAMLLDEMEDQGAQAENAAQAEEPFRKDGASCWDKLEDSVEELGDSIEDFVQRTVDKVMKGFGKPAEEKEKAVHIEIEVDRKGESLDMDVSIPLKVAHLALKWNEMLPEEAKQVLTEKGLDYTNQEFLDMIAAMKETGGDVICLSQSVGKSYVEIHIYVD